MLTVTRCLAGTCCPRVTVAEDCRSWESGLTQPAFFWSELPSGDRVLKALNFDVVVMDDFIYGEPQLLN